MRRSRTLFVATTFVVALGAGAVLGGYGPLQGAEQTTKGCWYEPPNPPACDICGWSCGAGQQCCQINES